MKTHRLPHSISPRFALFVVLSTFVLSAFSLQAFGLQASGLSPGSGCYQYTDSVSGKTLNVWYYKPADFTPQTPVLIVMHGANRVAESEMHAWVASARKGKYMVLAPEFTKEDFPGEAAYSLGNYMRSDKRTNPAEKWSFMVIERLFDDFVQTREKTDARQYYLYGHAAGAQFIHRFLLCVPGARVKLAVCANADFYTVPDPRTEWPHGIKGTGLEQDWLNRFPSLPLVILLSELDVSLKERALPRGEPVDRQGITRLARGVSFFNLGQAAAEKSKIPFGWRLQIVPRAYHVDPQLVPAAARLFTTDMTAKENPGKTSQAKPEEYKVHGKGRIRAVYQTEGPDAVQPDDKNQNGIPDQVEDALIQVEAARALFVEVLGFPDPLEAKRNRSAKHVEIRFTSKDPGTMGVGWATRGLPKSRVPGVPNDTRCLVVSLLTTSNPGKNATMTHEYFHLIQHGVSYFGNKWYSEGTARWADGALGTKKLAPVAPPAEWPLSPDKAAEIFAQSYSAAGAFWRPLIARVDPDGVLPEGPALDKLRAMKYTDGTPVLKHSSFPGGIFMRDVLLELGKADALALKEQHNGRWSSEARRSPKNNAYILRAVEKVVARYEDMRNQNSTKS